MSRSSEETQVIEGPGGDLELAITRVEAPVAIAVVCHPHPLQGGTLNNKVVHTLMRAARDKGASVVRFNFRGVGRSSGNHDHGVGEVDDCLAVLRWAQANLGSLPVWLMGFSFGGYVAAAAARRLSEWPERLQLVAPSVERLPFAGLLPLGRTVVYMGEADEVVAPEAVFDLLEGQPDVEVVRFAETGHFFHGRLVELKEAVASRLA
ncbi:alpha/beta hydrolase [Pseudomonas sp.]|uniref:alpha/beta hydrolase n=1 Tax=Pseudomonas sp. TaxID=306 RepID=UPI00272A28AD|nr:alpha/beta fold hydrolase [Pseudomonas sp.]